METSELEEQQPEETASNSQPEETACGPLVCYHCGSPVSEGQETCPRCLRGQYRVCFCGKKIEITAAFCEFCGADWRRSARTHRRKSKKLRPAEIGRAAIVGCGVALAAGTLLSAVVDTLARREAQTVGPLPASFVERLSLAGGAIRDGVQALIHLAAGHLGSLLLLLGLALVGALGGALVYLKKEGVWIARPRGRKSRHGSRGVRSRQGPRRNGPPI